MNELRAVTGLIFAVWALVGAFCTWETKLLTDHDLRKDISTHVVLP